MICNLEELKSIFNINQESDDESIKIEGVSTDTRSLKNNQIFIAIKGENFDGHSFVQKAIEIGARAIIVDEDYDISNLNFNNFIRVKDTIKAYGDIAKFYRLKNKFKVVAITGSSGKTTTKDMVACVLSKKYKVEKTYKNNNNEIGLPFTILNAEADTEVLVLEMGMRARGEIEYLTKVAQPDIGIITNVGIAHIGELGSQENIMHSKGELLENLPNDAIAIINGEDGFTDELKKKFSGDIRVFGFNDNATIKVENIAIQGKSSNFNITRNNISNNVTIKVKGEHLILDCLIAIETGLILGIDLDVAVEALNHLEVSPGRLELIEMENYLIINDTYNANPDSMKKSIDVLFSHEGNRIAVLGDMRELGENEVKYHEEIGRYLSGKGLKALVTVGELGKHIGLGLEKSENGTTPVYSYGNNLEAGKKLKDLVGEDDTILIKGSRAMAMEEIIEILEEDKEV